MASRYYAPMMIASAREWQRLCQRASILWTPELRQRMRFVHHTYTNAGSPCSRTELLLDGRPIWTFPNDYFDSTVAGHTKRTNIVARWGSHSGVQPEELFGMLRDFVNTAPHVLLERQEKENYHLLDILRAADRRISYVRLMWWTITQMSGGNNPARAVLSARYGTTSSV